LLSFGYQWPKAEDTKSKEKKRVPLEKDTKDYNIPGYKRPPEPFIKEDEEDSRPISRKGKIRWNERLVGRLRSLMRKGSGACRPVYLWSLLPMARLFVLCLLAIGRRLR